jgi:WD40-like Beta Propeller Repeat
MALLCLPLIFSTTPLARAQGPTAELAPREEVIDAIMNYVRSGGCEALNQVLGSGVGDLCKTDPSKEQMLAKQKIATLALAMGLPSVKDAELIEICARTKLDCEKRPEVSAGRPILTFHASVGVKGATPTAAWSPDNRFLLVYAFPELGPRDRPPRLGYTLVVDIEQQQARALLTDPVATYAVAWSPDGRYIAFNNQRAIHLYALDTLEEKASIAPGPYNKCSTHSADRMVFTGDSRALWVACGGFGGSYGLQAIAIKLGVPALQIEDRLLPNPPDARASFRTTAISRFGDDLILVGEARGGSYDKPELSARSFSLGRKEPLHPPVSYVSAERSEYNPDVFLTDDLSGILIRRAGWLPDGAELWSTRSGERVVTLHPKTMMDGRALGAPNRIPHSPLHISEQLLPLRSTLVVFDSRSGDTVQEIGWVVGSPHLRQAAGVRNVLVSPDGKMAAHFGRYEIRFYGVNADAAAPLPAQGR